MRFCLVFCSALLVLSSCAPGTDPEGCVNVFSDSVMCEFSVEVDRVGDGQCAVRSSFVEEDIMRITCLNVFVYHNGYLLSDCCRYYDDMSSLMLSFPSGMNGFNIYMLGNVGRITPPEVERELGNLKCVIDSYSDFNTRGVPVAGTFEGYRKGNPAHFKLKRLVGQYNIQMRVSADDAKYTVKSLGLKNCAKDFYPFCDDARAEMFDCFCDEGPCGDRLTDEDVCRLNAGEVVSLYFMENLQGELLPGNTDRKSKIPSAIDAVESGASDRCTYLEVVADLVTPAAKYTDGKYRFYLGANQTSDFSIRRNTLYNVVLDFTQNMVDEQEWRIEVDAPQVVDVKIDKEEAMVIKGAVDMVYVQAYDNNGNLMDFDVSVLSSNGYVNAEKVSVDYREYPSLGKAMGVRLTSNVDLVGLYSYGAEPTYLTEFVRVSSRETYNGRPVFSKDIKVRVYNKLFPLYVKFEKGTYAYSPVVRGRNPMGLGLKIMTTYSYDGLSYTIGATRINTYLSSGTVQEGAVGVEGKSFGTFSADMTADNITSVNFAVTGVSSTAGNPIAYPCLVTSGEMFPGSGTAAHYGPGTSLVPGSLPNLKDDYMYAMYCAPSSGSAVYCGPILYDWPATFSGSYVWASTYVKSTDLSECYFETTAGYGVDKHVFAKDSRHEICPFYFLNAGMNAHSVNVSFDCELVKYPNESVSRIDVVFRAPGRDLFAEKKGVGAFCKHEMGYKVSVWKNLVGKAKSEQNSKYYKGQLFMTINGASSWVGADTTENGFFP